MGNSMTMAGKGRRVKGFTLIELMVTLIVASIVLTLGVPGLQGFFDSKRLIDATEQVASHLQQARMEAIARSAPVGITVNFSANGTTTWQYGVSHTAACDLTKTTSTDLNACVIVTDDGDGTVDPGDGSVDAGDLVLMRFTNAEFDGVTMNAPVIAGGGTDITFDPVRGTAQAGDIKLISDGGRQLTVRVGILGQIRICSNDGSVQRYSTAGCV